MYHLTNIDSFIKNINRQIEILKIISEDCK